MDGADGSAVAGPSTGPRQGLAASYPILAKVLPRSRNKFRRSALIENKRSFFSGALARAGKLPKIGKSFRERTRHLDLEGDQSFTDVTGGPDSASDAQSLRKPAAGGVHARCIPRAIKRRTSREKILRAFSVFSRAPGTTFDGSAGHSSDFPFLSSVLSETICPFERNRPA